MKKFILLFLPIVTLLFAFNMKKEDAEKAEIEQVVKTFMGCLHKKDSVKFYSLFHKDPVVWVGVSKEKSYQDDLKKDSTAREYFSSTYKRFYKSIADNGSEIEKFSNIQIVNDERIAAVTFDYSFWKNNKKENWGKESWGMVKVNGKWKIASVLFSYEMEEVAPEPRSKGK